MESWSPQKPVFPKPKTGFKKSKPVSVLSMFELYQMWSTSEKVEN
jgi:hypothetical protein